ncbi:unnamed protein product [marine sediment metagenome]|uniref:YvrJ family protein n=1 Tax=marine sediment metagenome TaxID=412755 RepID=X1MRS4_9ZZZZ
MYEQITAFIKDLGFPIFVAAYLLIHFRKSLKENTEAIMELTRLVRNLNNKNARKPAKKG